MTDSSRSWTGACRNGEQLGNYLTRLRWLMNSGATDESAALKREMKGMERIWLCEQSLRFDIRSIDHATGSYLSPCFVPESVRCVRYRWTANDSKKERFRFLSRGRMFDSDFSNHVGRVRIGDVNIKHTWTRSGFHDRYPDENTGQ